MVQVFRVEGPVSAVHERVEVDQLRNRIGFGGACLELRPLVVDLAIYFGRLPPGQVVSRPALARDVWQKNYVSDESINQVLFGLRRALEKLGVQGTIQTVRKRGYMLSPGLVFCVSAPVVANLEKPGGRISPG